MISSKKLLSLGLEVKGQDLKKVQGKKNQTNLFTYALVPDILISIR